MSIGESVSFREKLFKAHECLLDCNLWILHSRASFEDWTNKFDVGFDLTGSREFQLATECHDLLTDMIKIMQGDRSDKRRNDEPNQEGRVDNQHAP